MLNILTSLALLYSATYANHVIEITTPENTSAGTKIGSVRAGYGYSSSSSSHSFRCYDNFFAVDSENGDVKMARTIDLESLCPQFQLCCGTSKCVLDANIIVTDKNSLEHLSTIKLSVTITDVNDNSPQFSSKEQILTILESAPIGTKLGFETASDLDFDLENRTISYHYLFDHLNKGFELDLPHPRLILKHDLDRETKSVYKGTLRACDRGKNCIDQPFTILIKDVNDNKPAFPSPQLYRETLDENFSIGSSVLQLKATDPDEGENGHILYSFNGQIDPNLKDTFEIEPNTGNIRLKKPLAAHVCKQYSFSVKVCDAPEPTCPGEGNSVARVELNIRDINDHAPMISIQPLEGFGTSNGYSSGIDLTITENDPPKALAFIEVKDLDLGKNADVSCELDYNYRNDFNLSKGSDNLFTLKSKRVFDHEEKAILIPTITCKDEGRPQKSSSVSVNARIKDVNEFSPEFARNSFKGSVNENTKPGYPVINVTATDNDGGHQLRYRFGPPPGDNISKFEMLNQEDIDKMGTNKYFQLDSFSGAIKTSSISLDREEIEQITLSVIVTDAETGLVKTASTNVHLDVKDMNDNAPTFIKPQTIGSIFNGEYGISIDSITKWLEKDSDDVFTIMENSAPGTRLQGFLQATDPDKGLNSEIEFKLNATYAMKKEINHGPGKVLETNNLIQIKNRQIFKISNGNEIEVLEKLDREDVSLYILEVIAKDKGQPQQSSSTIIRIQVGDLNDNKPEWDFPKESDNQLNITTSLEIGQLVVQLRAHDFDAGENGKLEYQLLDSRGESVPAISEAEGMSTLPSSRRSVDLSREFKGYRHGPLYLNGSTGLIWVASQLEVGPLHLRIRVYDSGSPGKGNAEEGWLHINVNYDPLGPAWWNFSSNTLNVTIILVMIAITALISLILIVAIVCVRKKPVRSFQGHLNNPNDQLANVIDYYAATQTSPGLAMIGSGPRIIPTAAGYYVEDSGCKELIADPATLTMWGGADTKYCYTDENGAIPVSYSAYSSAPGLMCPPSDTTSMLFMPNGSIANPISTPASSQNTQAGAFLAPSRAGFYEEEMLTQPPDFLLANNPSSNMMHTFGQTLNRMGNRSQPMIDVPVVSQNSSPAFYILDPTVSPLEPAATADSGDSGRGGSSEEGTQPPNLDSRNTFMKDQTGNLTQNGGYYHTGQLNSLRSVSRGPHNGSINGSYNQRLEESAYTRHGIFPIPNSNDASYVQQHPKSPPIMPRHGNNLGASIGSSQTMRRRGTTPIGYVQNGPLSFEAATGSLSRNTVRKNAQALNTPIRLDLRESSQTNGEITEINSNSVIRQHQIQNTATALVNQGSITKRGSGEYEGQADFDKFQSSLSGVAL